MTNKDLVHAEGSGSLYERDYYGWVQHNARAIRQRRLDEVDWANVAGELEDMGRGERRALRTQLARLTAHLLKWRYQMERRKRSEHSWRATIEHARDSVRELLDENPSLRSQVAELFPAAYRDGLAQVISETNLPKQNFPALCPWALTQMMDDDFWPEA